MHGLAVKPAIEPLRNVKFPPRENCAERLAAIIGDEAECLGRHRRAALFRSQHQHRAVGMPGKGKAGSIFRIAGE